MAAIAELLVKEREALLASIASLTADVAEVVAAASGSNGDDEHDPEGATIAFERARLATRLSDAEHALAGVEGAIRRLAEGNYGRCQRCAAPIGEERLRAIPATQFCIRCAALCTPRGPLTTLT
ncbi:MAG TPA: TraR/DksA C4-type zinc finger protein [Acidimicrobiales bacterium]|nr:TraR/DksA C4-type zinc finger protein [Acidimicrobiales bacterium]